MTLVGCASRVLYALRRPEGIMNPYPQYTIAQQHLDELRRDPEHGRVARQLRREKRRAGTGNLEALFARLVRPQRTDRHARPASDVARPAHAVSPRPAGSEQGVC